MWYLINVYFTCDYENLDSLIECKSNYSDLVNLISTENFDVIIVDGDFICDSNKGRFLNLNKTNKQNKIYYRNYTYTKYTIQFPQALNKLKSFYGNLT